MMLKKLTSFKSSLYTFPAPMSTLMSQMRMKPIVIASTHMTQSSKLGFFTLQRHAFEPRRFDAKRFFSSSSSENDNESGDENPDQEGGSRKGGADAFNRVSKGDFVTVDLKAVQEKIGDGSLDQMDGKEFSIFLQKFARAYATQRDVPTNERQEILESLANYTKQRMEKDQEDSLMYLHMVGDLIYFFQRPSGTSRSLKTLMQQTVLDAYSKAKDGGRSSGVPQILEEQSLYRLAQIIRGMPLQRRGSQELFRLAVDLLGREDEPKPILAVFRLLDVLSSSTDNKIWSQREQTAIFNAMLDPTCIDIENINVRMRVNIL